MEFRILGSLAVLVDGQPAALGGPKQRAVLAMLLLHANEAVARDRLVEAVWGERPPDAREPIARQLHLAPADPAGRRARRPPGAGHLLRVEPDELDLDRFEALVAHAGELSATR